MYGEEQTSEIHVQLMGDVQIEILQRMIKERFGVLVEFGEGSIVYKETITAPVEGVGHFEPLRHYAEVHLRLEPGERGSGMQFAAECSEDIRQKLAAACSDTSGREGTQRCADRFTNHGYEDYADFRTCTSETYGRRRFSSGNLSCSASGIKESRQYSSWSHIMNFEWNFHQKM